MTRGNDDDDNVFTGQQDDSQLFLKVKPGAAPHFKLSDCKLYMLVFFVLFMSRLLQWNESILMQNVIPG